MDLGAPILDVQASVSVSDTSSSAAQSTAKVESIISGGVVSAPGYDPIVIATPTSTAPVVEGGVFVPDIPIMQVDNYYTLNENKTVDRTQVITHINSFDGGEIVQIKDKEITIIEGTDNTAVMICVIAAALILLVLLIMGIRFVCNKIKAEKIKQEQIRTAQLKYNNGGIKAIPKKTEFNTKIEPGPVEDGKQQKNMDQQY